MRADRPEPPSRADKAALALRGVIVCGHVHADKLDSAQSVFTAGVRIEGDFVAQDSIFLGHAGSKGSCEFKNVLVCGGGGASCGPDSRLGHCTISGTLQLSGMSGKVSDSIVSSVNASDGHTIEHCDVFGDNPYTNGAVAGKGCLNAKPQFADGRDLDFRLRPGSPCRKAAADGSDLGFAYTSEIEALLKVAASLRNRTRGKF